MAFSMRSHVLFLGAAAVPRIGDVAHVGTHPPQFASVYKRINGNFALPLGYDLVSFQ